MGLEMADINHGIWLRPSARYRVKRKLSGAVPALLSASQGSTAAPVGTGDAGKGRGVGCLGVFALRDALTLGKRV